MKYLYLTLFFCLIQTAKAQNDSYTPNELRNDIYKKIIEDINQINPNYLLKEIFLDPSHVTFESIELASTGINFGTPSIKFDSVTCNNLHNTQCVNAFEIDKYTITKTLTVHKDTSHQDFYGIYPPLDKWFSLIKQFVTNHFENEKSNGSSVLIPVKHIYFKKEEIISEYLFYKINIDKNYKIVLFERINLVN